MKKYVISVCIIIGLIFIGLIAFGLYRNMNSNISNEELIISKANQELKYLNNTITNLANEFHQISYTNYKLVENEVNSNNSKNSQQQQSNSETSSSGQSSNSTEENNIQLSYMEQTSILTNGNEKIDWNAIKAEVELLYTTWPSILVDLNSLNVNKDNLLSFTNILDDLTKSLDEEDEIASLTKLSDLYGLLSSYIKEYSNDSTLNNVFTARSYIIKAYALAEDNKWNEMKQNINYAKSDYTNIMNNSLNSNNINSINRGYILLNEIDKNIDQQDKNLFYINYKNLMQELDTLI